MASAEWYYIDADTNYVGPVDAARLRQLAEHHYLEPHTYVWAKHLSGWMRFSTVPELAPPAADTAPPAAVQAPAPAEVPAAPNTASVSAMPALPSLGLRRRRASDAAARQLAASASMPPANLQQQPAGGGQPAATAAAAVAATTPALLAAPNATASPPPSLGRARAISAAAPNMAKAPECFDQWDPARGLRVLDASRRLRAIIKSDGEVQDCTGATLAYIEANGEVGTPEMDFLGHVHLASSQVVDKSDHPLGEYDAGRGFVKNKLGSVIAEISKDGSVTGNGQRLAGAIEGFKYECMDKVAAYVHLVDPDYVKGF